MESNENKENYDVEDIKNEDSLSKKNIRNSKIQNKVVGAVVFVTLIAVLFFTYIFLLSPNGVLNSSKTELVKISDIVEINLNEGESTLNLVALDYTKILRKNNTLESAIKNAKEEINKDLNEINEKHDKNNHNYSYVVTVDGSWSPNVFLGELAVDNQGHAVVEKGKHTLHISLFDGGDVISECDVDILVK